MAEPGEHIIHRKIIHIDMDAFYASVEQRDNPELRGKPLVVGGLPEGRGGVVATASYEARKFGIRSAMPSKTAQKLCPDALFVRPRFAEYKEVSRCIREIFSRYTDLIEPLSLDEAYLDVTDDKLNIGSAIEIAKQIKQAIKDELHLTASAGVSINKFVAKIASDINKPDGLTFIGPSSIQNFMEKLPVEKFHGVGKVTAQKMKGMNLHTGLDLKQLNEDEMIRHFGKAGRFYYQIVRGIDNRAVQPHRETKSMGAEDTFAYDLTETDEMHLELDKLAQKVVERLQKYQLKGRTLTLKIKYSDFKQITRNQSFSAPIADLETIQQTAKQLLANTEQDKKIRLLGISLSNFNEVVMPVKDDYGQLKLF
ncbi:DNA polymerase IV [Mucilaginibacter polytrichastri]|uniref:DNA polymerase IV n=1 Tax=Mucilaginibacter polytrichastri TaxID=1302689 RepID=A0A1Q6A3U3_9SPHI|nr:DNA polymerase IV [Mucilaginibacter polytrichastri]OKS88673.1 DNA polymerase IV [Mucilaginibacter polytrichastri]SFT04309.1 DNA polymerase-4 [Mucilaginibacter polytrichastri]